MANKHPSQEHTPIPISKKPTGLGTEPLNIVILGASYAGLAVAHHFLDHTINQLQTNSHAPAYRLIIISPSTHMYWNIAAPHALVTPDLIDTGKLFVPIEQALHRHRAHKPTIIQGEAIAIDTSARILTIDLVSREAQKRASQVGNRRSIVQLPGSIAVEGRTQTLDYHALIIATGSSAHSELMSLHGTHLNTIGALNNFQSRIDIAKTIIVGGAGCTGVETAGQLATYLNHRTVFWPFRRRRKDAKRIILITSNPICLPRQHNFKLSRKAEEKLKQLGVEVMHNLRILAAKEADHPFGQMRVELSNGTSLMADIYIPCTGVVPNTAFFPPLLKDSEGYIHVGSDLRPNETFAGPRVYAIGGCASNTRRKNSLQEVYGALPVLMKNLLNDLLAHEYRLAGRAPEANALKDQYFKSTEKVSILLPITRFGGVGVFRDITVPSPLVHWLKGRNWAIHRTVRATERGKNPHG
jgi:apoptosis-inducing factor 2